MTGDEIKGLIATKTDIDLERIHILESLALLTISIDACKENEQSAVQAVLHQYGEATLAYDVVRREVPEKPPAYDLEKLNTMIREMGNAPDSQLDKMFTKRIRELPEDITLDQMVEFLRNLRDECVFCAGASGFVMTLFSCLLEDYPEPADVMAKRRALLEAKYGMKS